MEAVKVVYRQTKEVLKVKIKQVEELVGITQKNIRFYEEQGLLEVERAQNGYREYSEKDVARLKQIKMLRLISVTLEDIRLLFSSKKSLDDILEAQVTYLENQARNMERVCGFCKKLAEEDLTLETLDVEDCLEKIEQLEKEGARFMDISKTDVHLKKKIGAGISAGVMIIIFAIVVAAMIFAQMEDSIPIPVFLGVIAIPVVCIICLVVAFIQRNREIEGGEEDEASKY